jgi:signal transduction histidine kinase
MSNSPDEKFCSVHFKDSGPGLSDEVKNSLFEPFVTTKEDKGVGLGLYVSLKIIENHGGEIIYDEDYEQGTHFIIKLPLLRD